MMTRQAERKLIERATRGEKAAAEDLIRAHQASLYSYLLRLSGRPDVAEDIAQDAFVRVLANLHRFDPKYRFSTWLFTIAKRLYVNACQKLKPRYDSDIVAGVRSTTVEPLGPTAKREGWSTARTALRDALEALGDDQREIVILFHQQGWPIAFIAEHMGMPEGTVKSHLHRAREKMRMHINKTPARSRAIAELCR